ncbi:MAG TPA: TonB-dependent receptor [Sphingobium sp.]|uniref:TonB-dependent receptor n=1 Tax=Sphingobium sp. TaxID=1912891 RepID=UPI002ED6007A
MYKNFIRLAATASTLPFAALIANPAFAQAPAQATAPATADASAEASGPGDIVVTARRREESLQSVPVALSVLDSKTLDATGAFNVNRLQQQLPSVQFFSSNPRNSAINIRGLGAPFGLTNDGIEQGVGFYVDQVYIGRIGASTLDFVDVERVEVLRGPQGTLYGKNTTAGALNITTKKPSFSPEGQAEFSLGNYHFVQLKATVSGPITDNLAVRLSGSGTRRDGTVQNVLTGTDLQRQDNVGVRGSLLWKPTDTLDFTLSGDFNVQNPLCCVQYYARLAPTQRATTRQYNALAAAFGYRPPSYNAFDRVTDLDANINSRQEIGGVSLVANKDLGSATLTSVTAYRYWDWKPANDRDFTGLPITTVSQNPSQQRQFSQELRLASNGTNKLDYTVGAFFFTQTINTQGSQVQGSAASRWLLTGADSLDPRVLNGLTSTNTIHFSNQSAALFGKLNWAATDKLHVQPGIRLNYDKKSGYYDAVVSLQTGSPYDFVANADNVAALLNSKTGAAKTTLQNQLNTLAPQRYSPEFSDWNLSGDINVSYDFSRDVHGYATYAYSFKSGGINLSGLPLNSTSTGVDLTTQTVKPEKVNNFEVGLKTQFFDRKLTLNVAGYWTEISDYQATVNNNAVNVIRGYLANADKVRVRGFEFDGSVRPTEWLSLYSSGSYTDAKYVRFKNAPCSPERTGGTALPVDANGNVIGTPAAPGVPGNSLPYCDISGQVLPGVSKWAFSFGGEVHVPVGSSQGQVYLGYDGSYRSRFSSNPSPSDYMWIHGYSLSNFRVGYREGTKLNIFGWVRNAFNQNYYELLQTQSGSTGLIVGQPGDPRTWGLTVKTSF